MWKEEMKALPSFVMHRASGSLLGSMGSDLACPDCGKIGFYGARSSPNDPMYRMCKFCGLWQKVGGNPQRCNMFVHDCQAALGPLHDVAGYDWNMGSEHQCQREACKQPMTKKIQWPAEDGKHPFNNLLVYTCVNC